MILLHLPHQYALNKLESFEYVDLWYFTQEGCLDALGNDRFQEDALGFTKVGDILALKQLSAVKKPLAMLSKMPASHSDR